MEKWIIRPTREGLIVRDPITLKALSHDGELKPMNSYWVRRKRDGSVEEVKASPKPKDDPRPKPKPQHDTKKDAE